MIYELDQSQQDQLAAIPDPKHVWFDMGRIVVYTGDDIQVPTRTRDDIDAERDARLAAGVSWNGQRWHSDPDFQTQITGLVLAFSAGILAADTTVPVRTMANTIQQLNAAQVKTLAGVVLGYVQGTYAWSWTEKDKL